MLCEYYEILHAHKYATAKNLLKMSTLVKVCAILLEDVISARLLTPRLSCLCIKNMKHIGPSILATTHVNVRSINNMSSKWLSMSLLLSTSQFLSTSLFAKLGIAGRCVCSIASLTHH